MTARVLSPEERAAIERMIARGAGGSIDPRGRTLEQLVYRAMFERGLSARAERVLLGAFQEVATTILTAGAGVTLAERERVAQLMARLTDLLGRGYAQASALVTAELTALSQLEADVAAADLGAVVGTARLAAADAGAALPALPGLARSATVEASLFNLSRVQVEAIARLPALVDGLPLGDGWHRLAETANASVRRAVQQGLALGEPPAAIVRRILPPPRSISPAVWRGSRAQAATFVRTAITSVQSAAHVATYQAAGADVCERYRLLAVRDVRTSKICAALDGEEFRFDDPRRKIPPFHPNCRTVVLPIPNYAALGIRTPSRDDPRTAMLTFDSLEDWIRKQPTGKQDALLGPTRGRWYREGKLPLGDLIDQDNRVLTLDELRARLGL